MMMILTAVMSNSKKPVAVSTDTDVDVDVDVDVDSGSDSGSGTQGEEGDILGVIGTSTMSTSSEPSNDPSTKPRKGPKSKTRVIKASGGGSGNGVGGLEESKGYITMTKSLSVGILSPVKEKVSDDAFGESSIDDDDWNQDRITGSDKNTADIGIGIGTGISANVEAKGMPTSLILTGTSSMELGGEFSSDPDTDDDHHDDDDDAFISENNSLIGDQESVKSKASKAGTNVSATSFSSNIKKRKNYNKKINKYSSNNSSNSNNAFLSLEAQGAANITSGLSKIPTGVDLDIKVTLSKGVSYQVGSQGYPLGLKENGSRTNTGTSTGIGIGTGTVSGTGTGIGTGTGTGTGNSVSGSYRKSIVSKRTATNKTNSNSNSNSSSSKASNTETLNNIKKILYAGDKVLIKKSFLLEESELSTLVTKMIEAREEELYKLEIESNKVSKAQYSTIQYNTIHVHVHVHHMSL